MVSTIKPYPMKLIKLEGADQFLYKAMFKLFYITGR